MTLIELYKKNNGLRKYGQDKFGHHYAEVYDILFAPLQDKEINIFEVGFFTGGSCRLWLDYFPNAKVKCIDIHPQAHSRVLGTYIANPRFNFEVMDSNNLTPEYVKDFNPDIFIDDGSHILNDQLYIVKTVYPVLKPGGLLIIEDVQDIDKDKLLFEELGYEFVVADMRPDSEKLRKAAPDSVLIIYRKPDEIL
jgi:SAM-dependent methyltransferase